MKSIKTLFALALAFSMAVPAMASEEELRGEINALKSKLAELESRISQAPVTGSGSVPALAIPSMVQGVEMSGFVDTTYSYNFNQPTTLNPGNRGHVFDRHADSFNFNAAELVFKKAATEENRVGFRTDLYFGNDAEVIGSAGLGTTDDEFDLEQAYVEILTPTTDWVGSDISLKMGKFVTPFGAEVIESKDNWNISRGFLFGFALPFTHTGVWGNYNFNALGQGQHFGAGLVNGWDNVDDNNDEKTALFQWGFDGIALPGDSSLVANLTYGIGAEQSGNDNKRNLTDLVLIYKTPIKPLTLMYDFAYGHEENLLTGGLDDANWWSNAFYARYDVNDKWSVSGRVEFFDDEDGQRVISGTSNEYWGYTGTLEYRPWNNIITRLEYRHDDADASVFFDGATFADNQDIVIGEVIYVF